MSDGLSNILVTGGIGIFGTLLGAVVGALASGVIASRFEQKKQDALDSRGAFLVVHKLDRMQAAMRFMVDTISDGRRETAELKQPHICLSTQSATTQLPMNEFTPEELAASERFGGVGYVNAIRNLDYRANHIAEAFNEYGRQRAGLGEKLKVWVTADGRMAFASEQMLAIRPEATKLDDMLQSIDRQARELFPSLVGAAGHLVTCRGKYLKRDERYSFVNLEGEEVMVRAWPTGLPITLWSRLRGCVRFRRKLAAPDGVAPLGG